MENGGSKQGISFNGESKIKSSTPIVDLMLQNEGRIQASIVDRSFEWQAAMIDLEDQRSILSREI